MNITKPSTFKTFLTFFNVSDASFSHYGASETLMTRQKRHNDVINVIFDVQKSIKSILTSKNVLQVNMLYY